MGEQVTYSLSEALQETKAGTRLSYFGKEAFDMVLASSGSVHARTRAFAELARFNALYMIARAGSGHIGSSFSCVDVLSWLMLNEMDFAKDRYFSSKGHDSPAVYSVYAGLGIVPFDKIHALRRLGGLPGHPDVSTPGCIVNTGSLGMGISKAKGFVFADRLKGDSDRRIFVMTGDGELQEGQIWESLLSAANRAMGEITVIVDHNKVQSDSRVTDVSNLGDLEAKFHAFGWEVRRCDGHNFASLAHIFLEFNEVKHRPKVLIADTVKGKGVSFMEHTAMRDDEMFYRYHSGAPSREDYLSAVAELKDKVAHAALNLDISLPEPIEVEVEPLSVPSTYHRLVPAYTEALISAAEHNPSVVALDADLILDTGLIPFQEKFPNRFVECGIAEQDMVSQAGAMSLSGLLPVVHSFACFLAGRPHEQIYNACTEGSKIIYVGTLAGVLPAGPGHSHQAVSDIASMAAMPNMTLIEPATQKQVKEALQWCVEKARGNCYIRLVSIPCEKRDELDNAGTLEYAKGQVVRSGNDAVLIAYGPVMLAEALKAADLLVGRGIALKVVNMPWLNSADEAWLRDIVSGMRLVVTLDNHYLIGGQGQMLRSIIAGFSGARHIISIGLENVPACGRNDEVLKYHKLDAASIAERICNCMGTVS